MPPISSLALIRIYKELQDDLAVKKVSASADPNHGCLQAKREMGTSGRAGSTDAQHGADCTGASGEFSQRNRLGGVYRCSDHGSQRTGPSGRIHLMGSAGTAEKTNAQ